MPAFICSMVGFSTDRLPTIFARSYSGCPKFCVLLFVVISGCFMSIFLSFNVGLWWRYPLKISTPCDCGKLYRATASRSAHSVCTPANRRLDDESAIADGIPQRHSVECDTGSYASSNILETLDFLCRQASLNKLRFEHRIKPEP